MEKLRFPIKTKVAAWWTIGLAIIGIGIVIYFIRERESIPYYLLALVFFIFLFLSGFFILKNKKWAWRGGVFLLLAGWIILNLNPIGLIPWSIVITYLPYCLLMGDCYIGETMGISGNVLGLFLVLLVCQIPLVVPFIFFLLDRKNFWKIAN